jgi:hypothetical protein
MEKPNKKKSPMRRIIKVVLLVVVAWGFYTAAKAAFYQPRSQLLQTRTKISYLKGGYHMHSTHSDGKGTIPDLIKAAKEAGLDWIILTDHGSPNPGSQHASGWYEGVLLIGASEHSSDGGHLVVMGASTDYKLPHEPQLAIDDLNHHQGLTFLAHPFDDKIPWTARNVRDFTGLEVLSLYESVKSAPWYRMLQFPLQYAINPDYAILNVLTYPSEPLEEWDRYNQQSQRPYWGIFASDAHGRIPLSKNTALPFPGYQSMLSALFIYHAFNRETFAGLSTRDAVALVQSVIKSGSFFNVIETIAPADSIEMGFTSGDEDSGQNDDAPWIFSLKHGFEKVELRIYRNGQLFKSEQVEGDHRLPLKEPGRYRVELYMPDHSFSALPWVITNPVDLKPSEITDTSTPEAPPVTPPPVYTSIPLDNLGVEKNADSYAEIISGDDPQTLQPTRILRYSLRLPSEGRDSWCSLAMRQKAILLEQVTPHTGVYLEIASSRRCTFWLELRTTESTSGAERWYRHALTVDPIKRGIAIPFSAMKQIHGTLGRIEASSITGLFISINNSTAFVPAEGELTLFQLGGYRP